MKKLLIIITLLIIIGAISAVAFRIISPPSKINACKQIEQGITLEEFIDRFGAPIYKKEEDDEYWFLFSSDPLSAGPIKIRVNKTTNEIVELRCTEDGKPEWIADNK